MAWNGHDTSIRNKTLTHMAWNAEDIELFRLKLLDSLLDIFCLPRRDHYCRTLAGVCVCVCVFERENGGEENVRLGVNEFEVSSRYFPCES